MKLSNPCRSVRLTGLDKQAEKRPIRVLCILDVMVFDGAHRLDVISLGSAAGLEVVATSWSRARHPARSEVRLDYVAIEFMVSGGFVLGSRRKIVVDPNMAVMFQPGKATCVEHPFGNQNRGVTVRLSRERYAGIGEVEETLSDVKSCGYAVTSPDTHLALLRLNARATNPISFGELELEEMAVDLVVGTFQKSARIPDLSSDRSRQQTLKAVEYLNAHFEGAPRLGDIARAMNLSPWRASRVFSASTGVPLHRYLRRIRLREAMARIEQGQTSLTCVALDVGFSSHSHFAAAFRDEFGLTPRRFRKGSC